MLICRECGNRKTEDLALNEQELASVGMLEKRCARCGKTTRWGRAEDYRKRERRQGERRGRRERRGTERRSRARRAGRG